MIFLKLQSDLPMGELAERLFGETMSHPNQYKWSPENEQEHHSGRRNL